MRFHTVAAIALVFPSAVFAQRGTPRIGGARPGEPVPLGRQPEMIARSIAMQRSRYTVETYPLLSRVVAPAYSPGSPASSSNSFGAGTRLDYRYTRYVSWTLDLTTSSFNAPGMTETAEIGMRLRPEDAGRRLRPFADVRAGFEHSSDAYSSQTQLGYTPLSNLVNGERFSRGFGGVVGAGIEYGITNTFSLTSGVSAMRTNMTAYRYTGMSIPTMSDGFRMTTYRLAVGLQYRPVYSMLMSNRKTP